MADRPNVVLICVDQWRGDCLSIDGHPVVQTPYLDGWALDGARFARAYSATPTCVPARAALYTGLSQRRHGRVGYQDGVPWDYPVTIASEFTRHGYQTEAIGKLHVYPERSQMGFQHVVLHDGFLHYARAHHADHDRVDDYLPWLRQQLGRDADYFDHGVNCNSVVARPWDKPEHTHPTNFVVTQGIDFLRRRAMIAESVTLVGSTQVWGTPKGHEKREVPIPRFLVDQLAEHVRGKAPDDLVFAGVRGGGALRAPIFRRAAFDHAAEVIGMPGLHPHDMRHTAASLAIAAGADVKVVQKMLGHKSATMTLDQYGHLFDDRLDDIADRLDAAADTYVISKRQPRDNVRSLQT